MNMGKFRGRERNTPENQFQDMILPITSRSGTEKKLIDQVEWLYGTFNEGAGKSFPATATVAKPVSVFPSLHSVHPQISHNGYCADAFARRAFSLISMITILCSNGIAISAGPR